MEGSTFNKGDFDHLIRLKARQLRKESHKGITEKQIKEYLFTVKWNDLDKMPMCAIVDDIMGLGFSDLFGFLSVQVIKEAKNLKLEDFKDFISK
ncbi:post-transcriptional regulator [Tannockella kyphosi]|uniref:post-transcriptional regulator n=1 Tax=Tannockella kyphosi TaxID=2899121 RepID=UPI002011FDEF|nr:post-transcriptional regulator [Tannockella kyphosi]